MYRINRLLVVGCVKGFYNNGDINFKVLWKKKNFDYSLVGCWLRNNREIWYYYNDYNFDYVLLDEKFFRKL